MSLQSSCSDEWVFLLLVTAEWTFCCLMNRSFSCWTGSEIVCGQTASWPLTPGARSPADGREADVPSASSLFLMLMQLLLSSTFTLSLAVVCKYALIDGPGGITVMATHTHALTHTHVHTQSWTCTNWLKQNYKENIMLRQTSVIVQHILEFSISFEQQ